MQHRDLPYSNVVALRSMNNDNVHTNELVIEEYDQWSNSATTGAIGFSGNYCAFDGDSWDQAA